MIKIPHLLRISTGLVILLSLSSSYLAAQQSIPNSGAESRLLGDLETRQVELDLEAKPLSDILKSLSEQIGRGIIIDGKPIKTQASLKLHGTAKSALDRFAEEFDCSWTVARSGAILMSKRFHQPDDLPQVHLKEMQKMAIDLLAIWPENASKVRLKTYPFITPVISPGNALFRALTSEQRRYLSSGQPLLFQDLSSEQQKLVRLGMYNGAVGTSHDIWEGLNARLSNMPHSYLQWRSFFHGQLDAHPTPYQYSLEYIWPDLQDKGFDRLVPAEKVSDITGDKVLGGKAR